jgi:hypothetical protein
LGRRLASVGLWLAAVCIGWSANPCNKPRLEGRTEGNAGRCKGCDFPAWHRARHEGRVSDMGKTSPWTVRKRVRLRSWWRTDDSYCWPARPEWCCCRSRSNPGHGRVMASLRGIQHGTKAGMVTISTKQHRELGHHRTSKEERGMELCFSGLTGREMQVVTREIRLVAASAACWCCDCPRWS